MGVVFAPFETMEFGGSFFWRFLKIRFFLWFEDADGILGILIAVPSPAFTPCPLEVETGKLPEIAIAFMVQC